MSSSVKIQLLIVDDELNTRNGLKLHFSDDYIVFTAENISQAKEILDGENISLVLTDLRLGGDDGFELVEWILKQDKPPICMMMTAYGSVDLAVKAMRMGAQHFVMKPINLDELEIVIKRALRNEEIRDENVALRKQIKSKKNSSHKIIGKSEAMERLYELIEQVAPTRATVLIQGESGTGKELVAHAVHNMSDRVQSPFVIVHCAALSSQLLESELFGHEKGSFTGAIDKRIGRFELANGGTLFLDEIGEIDSNIQIKLLRALGEKTIERVGGNKTIDIDVRLVTASNKNLKKLVDEGIFREDLYYRLNVVQIDLPPLRDRREDIVLLASSFLQELSIENRKNISTFSEDVMEIMSNYDWPGNVRQLRSAIEHSIVMCRGDEIVSKNLPHYLLQSSQKEKSNTVTVDRDNLNLQSLEKQAIMKALSVYKNNKSLASKKLGISRRTLHRKISEYDLMKV